jgi:AhpC/TSA family
MYMTFAPVLTLLCWYFLLLVLLSTGRARCHEEGGIPMRSDITAGGRFPDYALPDQTDTVRSLSELQGDDPMILTLARGHYCPKEHQQHRELAAFQSRIAVAYTQIVTISTDVHHTLQEFRLSVGAQWTFLSPIPNGRSRRTSTSRNTPTRKTTR